MSPRRTQVASSVWRSITTCWPISPRQVPPPVQWGAPTSGADPSDRRLTIVPWDPFDSNLGLPRLDAAVSSRASASDYTSARATKLDNLDATVSSRSTLTAANVWANATRTITGTGTGAITAKDESRGSLTKWRKS